MFGENDISDDPERWGQFGDYFGGLLNPLISFLNLIVLTYLSLRLVKEDDQRSQWTLMELARPYAQISFNKQFNLLEINIENLGLGPLIIKNIIIIDVNGRTFKNFHQLLTPLKTEHDDFIIDVFRISNNHCAVGKENNIPLLKISNNKNEIQTKGLISEMVEKLNGHTIKIEYYDMYKRPMEPLVENIDFLSTFDI